MVGDLGLAEDCAQDALVAALQQWPGEGVPSNPGAWLVVVAQRIVRAKGSLARANVRFEVPERSELASRLDSVLEVIYLIFNEGYSATAGGEWMRVELCSEALRLGRIVVGLVPQEAEAHGLVALMELQASRLRARTGRTGEPI